MIIWLNPLYLLVLSVMVINKIMLFIDELNAIYHINVRQYRRGNLKLTIRRNETGNIWYTRGKKTKQKHNTICAEHHYTQANTNNINKTEPSYRQLEVMMNRTSFSCINRSYFFLLIFIDELDEIYHSRHFLSTSFDLTIRYIDDVRSLNNSRFGDFVDLSPWAWNKGYHIY